MIQGLIGSLLEKATLQGPVVRKVDKSLSSG